MLDTNDSNHNVAKVDGGSDLSGSMTGVNKEEVDIGKITNSGENKGNKAPISISKSNVCSDSGIVHDELLGDDSKSTVGNGVCEGAYMPADEVEDAEVWKACNIAFIGDNSKSTVLHDIEDDEGVLDIAIPHLYGKVSGHVGKRKHGVQWRPCNIKIGGGSKP